MDLRVRALRSVQIPPQSPMEEGTMTIAPVLPYRSSTMPENLSVRLKHPNVLCANSWLKRSPSDHSDHPTLSLRCSRYLDVEKRRSRPASLAPEVNHIDKSLPPPLPPKRISSQTSNLTILSLKQKEFGTETSEDACLTLCKFAAPKAFNLTFISTSMYLKYIYADFWVVQLFTYAEHGLCPDLLRSQENNVPMRVLGSSFPFTSCILEF
ncbi:hypothetical protein EGR_01987 [Echinococcus granulosus]|uniref:Uncharacterized protein n=1 Tax=Echinococcus granulosus TaxID=6210 RepID=W6UPJ7_ECHGR|nr:hypothetical protein EGR_01987 [Echinococcus granulosus]EUB63183.1 hypothetical protein EGR_01987 [Echinococcus granulosus]